MLYTINLYIILHSRRISYSHLAKQIGPSRQAVSKWFAKDICNIQTKYLIKLLQILKIDLKLLLLPIPLLRDQTFLKRNQALLNWDNLAPSLYDYFINLAKFHYPSVARYVSVCGIFEAAKCLGKRVWTDFDYYKKYLSPIKQKEATILWNLHKDLNLK